MLQLKGNKAFSLFEPCFSYMNKEPLFISIYIYIYVCIIIYNIYLYNLYNYKYIILHIYSVCVLPFLLFLLFLLKREEITTLTSSCEKIVSARF